MVKYLKKNESTPRPSEHPPVMGEKMSKRLLSGIKGCKYKKNSSWYLNRFPDAITLGQQYNVGERPTVILHNGGLLPDIILFKEKPDHT